VLLPNERQKPWSAVCPCSTLRPQSTCYVDQPVVPTGPWSIQVFLHGRARACRLPSSPLLAPSRNNYACSRTYIMYINASAKGHLGWTRILEKLTIFGKLLD
jgi:hypothetical protein